MQEGPSRGAGRQWGQAGESRAQHPALIQSRVVEQACRCLDEASVLRNVLPQDDLKQCSMNMVIL